MAATPAYAATPTTGSGLLTTGDTSRTAPAATVTFFTPGASGGMCERIEIMPVATMTATVLRLWYHDGANYRLFFELQMAAFTAAAGTAIAPVVLSAVDYPQLFPRICPTGSTLRASINDTQTGVVVIGEGGSL